jgi:hypothetical protein
MYLYDNQSNAGRLSDAPRMHPRCPKKEFTAPQTYEELESIVRRWISTCVMSRTKVRGVPVRREQVLVNGNPTLKKIWDDVLQYYKGRKVVIMAQYVWLRGGVEKIVFSTPMPPPPPQPKPQQPAALVWPNAPLPPSEIQRFQKALKDLETKVYSTTDPRRWRYLCWIEKLKKPDVDDRIIRWARICPKTSGAIGAAYVVGGCDPTQGTPVNQAAFERSIRSVGDVETANKSLEFITYMKPDIVVSYEMTSQQLENLRMVTDEAGRAIDKLDFWANNPMGGSSAMPPAYRAVKDWIMMRQKDPKSVYSCF